MTEHEIVPFKAKKKEINNFRILTNALLSGQKVKVEGQNYKLGETNYSGSFKPVIVLDDGMILGSEISFEALFTMSLKMTDDELFMVSANTVLNDKGN